MRNDIQKEESVSIRNMTVEDIPEVVMLDLDVTGVQEPVAESGVIDSYVSGELGLSCVAELEGQIIGYILGRLAYTPAPNVESAWIQLIGVDAAHRRGGIGRRLVEGFRQRSHEKGAKIIHASVPAQNVEVQTFLQNNGFQALQWVHFTAPV
ncbi:MAG TPA: GNAT family N-acetyltransferase [Dehalococcoidia bacterium]|nr:GNAT family N-acetyltransferase [Dehalococcoidia bacterium]